MRRARRETGGIGRLGWAGCRLLGWNLEVWQPGRSSTYRTGADLKLGSLSIFFGAHLCWAARAGCGGSRVSQPVSQSVTSVTSVSGDRLGVVLGRERVHREAGMEATGIMGMGAQREKA